jgi:hypothetical protein
MIHRNKPQEAPPALLDQKYDKHRRNCLIEKSEHKVEDFYRTTTIRSLMGIYKNKCAICERKRGTELQVDHYRPKKPRNHQSHAEYNQPGYYWLAYEWVNLLPLCSKCNGKKSNKFPLQGWSEINRISDHDNVNDIDGFDAYSMYFLQEYERPLMLNPEYEENPERHFSFRHNGKIVGRTEEGRETIRICNLNRKDLRRERIEIREKYVRRIRSAFDDFVQSGQDVESVAEFKGELKGIFKSIKYSVDIDEEHSLFCTYLYVYFDGFVASKLPEGISEKASEYFEEFKLRMKG